MLTHLEEHPEDFDGDIYPCTWYNLLGDVSRQGTFIEQVVTRNMKQKVFKKLRRDKYLQAIVKQTIDPEKPALKDPNTVFYAGVGGGGGSVGTGVGNPAQIAAQQHLHLHKLYQQQMALNAAQGINYGAGGVGGMGANLLGTTSTTSTYTQP